MVNSNELFHLLVKLKEMGFEMASDKVELAVNDARKAAVNTIIEMMEKKGLEWVCEWDNAAFLPHNGATDRRYHGGNRLHLMARTIHEGYEDSRWFTFNQAKALGYRPKKDEHGTLVEYWKTIGSMRDENGEITHDPNEAVEKDVFPVLVSYAVVFNAAQLVNRKDGTPMPPAPNVEREEPLSEELMGLADILIESSRCEVDEGKHIAQAAYSPSRDVVMMPDRTGFRDMEGYITTLTHEMTHSTMKPLNRTEAAGNAFGSTAYAYEELIAELGSTFTCLELGIHRSAELEGDENFANHAAYLQSWLKKFRDDPDYLFKAASSADKAADYLIKNYRIQEEEHIEEIRNVLVYPNPEQFKVLETSRDKTEPFEVGWSNARGTREIVATQRIDDDPSVCPWCIEMKSDIDHTVTYGHTFEEAYTAHLKSSALAAASRDGKVGLLIKGYVEPVSADNIPESLLGSLSKVEAKLAKKREATTKSEKKTPRTAKRSNNQQGQRVKARV